MAASHDVARTSVSRARSSRPRRTARACASDAARAGTRSRKASAPAATADTEVRTTRVAMRSGPRGVASRIGATSPRSAISSSRARATPPSAASS
jgi:hypothetical protein